MLTQSVHLGLFKHVWTVFFTVSLALSVIYCSSLCLYHSQATQFNHSKQTLIVIDLAQDKCDHYKWFSLYWNFVARGSWREIRQRHIPAGKPLVGHLLYSENKLLKTITDGYLHRIPGTSMGLNVNGNLVTSHVLYVNDNGPWLRYGGDDPF